MARRHEEAERAVQACRRRRELDGQLAAAGSGLLAKALHIPPHLAKALGESPRLSGRAASAVRKHAGLGHGEPPSEIARIMGDPEKAGGFAAALGLALTLGRCGATLLKADIEAWKRFYSPEAVDFAFRHRAPASRLTEERLANAMALLDVTAVRAAGEAALMGWARQRFGQDASWLSTLFPGAQPAQARQEAAAFVQSAFEEWWLK